jgi:hypothetical protein
MDELETVDESSVERFLSRWYGVARPAGELPDERLPPPLARWVELTGAARVDVTQYYQVRSPDTMAVVDGLLVFCDDPAGEFVWACDRHGADPSTHERMNDGSEWRHLGIPLSSLLLYVAVAGAVMSARTGLVNTNIPAASFSRAVRHFRKLQDPLWSWPDPNLSFYSADQLLAFGGKSGDPTGWQLLIGATDSEALSVFDDIEWEWDSRRAGDSR